VASTKQVGDLGERIAEAFLILKGYQILRRNFRYAGREIDLLARNGKRLIAIEVKLRRGASFGRAVEAVDARKLARIRVALEAVLTSAPADVKPQIDVVVIDFAPDLSQMVVRHIEAVC
jgi:putative endonuclease